MEPSNTAGTTAPQSTAVSVGLDLSKEFDTVKSANEGVKVELYHPGTNVTLPGLSVHVLGRDSTMYRRISAEQNRRRIQKMSKGGSFRLGVISPEEMENDSLMLLAACTQGWTGIVVDGKELPFSSENAAMLYTRFPWIKEQVDQAVGDRALFTKG